MTMAETRTVIAYRRWLSRLGVTCGVIPAGSSP